MYFSPRASNIIFPISISLIRLLPSKSVRTRENPGGRPSKKDSKENQTTQKGISQDPATHTPVPKGKKGIRKGKKENRKRTRPIGNDSKNRHKTEGKDISQQAPHKDKKGPERTVPTKGPKTVTKIAHTRRTSHTQ